MSGRTFSTRSSRRIPTTSKLSCTAVWPSIRWDRSIRPWTPGRSDSRWRVAVTPTSRSFWRWRKPACPAGRGVYANGDDSSRHRRRFLRNPPGVGSRSRAATRFDSLRVPSRRERRRPCGRNPSRLAHLPLAGLSLGHRQHDGGWDTSRKGHPGGSSRRGRLGDHDRPGRPRSGSRSERR